MFCGKTKQIYLLKKKEAPTDHPQPCSFFTNPSSVKTIPNGNLQQSEDFAANQNSKFTPQHDEGMPTQ